MLELHVLRALRLLHLYYIQLHMLFYINSWCKQARQFSDDHTSTTISFIQAAAILELKWGLDDWTQLPLA